MNDIFFFFIIWFYFLNKILTPMVHADDISVKKVIPTLLTTIVHTDIIDIITISAGVILAGFAVYIAYNKSTIDSNKIQDLTEQNLKVQEKFDELSKQYQQLIVNSQKDIEKIQRLEIIEKDLQIQNKDLNEKLMQQQVNPHNINKNNTQISNENAAGFVSDDNTVEYTHNINKNNTQISNENAAGFISDDNTVEHTHNIIDSKEACSNFWHTITNDNMRNNPELFNKFCINQSNIFKNIDTLTTHMANNTNLLKDEIFWQSLFSKSNPWLELTIFFSGFYRDPLDKKIYNTATADLNTMMQSYFKIFKNLSELKKIQDPWALDMHNCLAMQLSTEINFCNYFHVIVDKTKKNTAAFYENLYKNYFQYDLSYFKFNNFIAEHLSQMPIIRTDNMQNYLDTWDKVSTLSGKNFLENMDISVYQSLFNLQILDSGKSTLFPMLLSFKSLRNLILHKYPTYKIPKTFDLNYDFPPLVYQYVTLNIRSPSACPNLNTQIWHSLRRKIPFEIDILQNTEIMTLITYKYMYFGRPVLSVLQIMHENVILDFLTKTAII